MQYFLFGVSGAGKSTSAFERFMLPAFRSQQPNPEDLDFGGTPKPQGRDVFGNIYIDKEKIEKYLGFPIRYKYINSQHLRDPANWPNIGEADDEGKPTSFDAGLLFTPASLIVIDEARSVWRNNDTIDHRILRAIDTQRHFSNDEGYGIDIIWMGQTKKQFHRELRDNGEAFYKLSSLSEMGKKDCHKLTIFKDWSCRASDVIWGPNEVVHDKELYGMYSSVAVGKADRHVLDKRIFSVKHSPKFYIYLMVGIALSSIILVGVILYFLNRSTISELPNSDRKSDMHAAGILTDGSKYCDEPTLIAHGDRFVVRTDADGFTRAVADDGSCRGDGPQSRSSVAGIGAINALVGSGR
jgi:zona occludens toxin (predicted ATPase)